MSLINLTPAEGQTAPAEDTLADTKTENTEPLVTPETDTETEGKTVVMDGPLSKIYTQALNLAYANEAASASGQTDIKILFDETIEQNDEPAKDLYVYCCDSGDISNEDVIKGTDKLRLALDGRYKQALVVMESHHCIKPIAGLLEEYAFKTGIKVVFTRDLAIETIKQLLN